MAALGVSKLIGSIILLIIAIVVIVVSSIYLNVAINDENAVKKQTGAKVTNQWKGLYIILLTVGIGLFIMAIVGILKSANVGKLNEWMHQLKAALDERRQSLVAAGRERIGLA